MSAQKSSDKSKLCDFYARGACNRGVKCQFSHEFSKNAPTNEQIICRFGANCRYGSTCKFKHPPKKQSNNKTSGRNSNKSPRKKSNASLSRKTSTRTNFRLTKSKTPGNNKNKRTVSGGMARRNSTGLIGRRRMNTSGTSSSSSNEKKKMRWRQAVRSEQLEKALLSPIRRNLEFGGKNNYGWISPTDQFNEYPNADFEMQDDNANEKDNFDATNSRNIDIQFSSSDDSTENRLYHVLSPGRKKLNTKSRNSNEMSLRPNHMDIFDAKGRKKSREKSRHHDIQFSSSEETPESVTLGQSTLVESDSDSHHIPTAKELVARQFSYFSNNPFSIWNSEIEINPEDRRCLVLDMDCFVAQENGKFILRSGIDYIKNLLRVWPVDVSLFSSKVATVEPGAERVLRKALGLKRFLLILAQDESFQPIQAVTSESPYTSSEVTVICTSSVAIILNLATDSFVPISSWSPKHHLDNDDGLKNLVVSLRALMQPVAYE